MMQRLLTVGHTLRVIELIRAKFDACTAEPDYSCRLVVDQAPDGNRSYVFLHNALLPLAERSSEGEGEDRLKRGECFPSMSDRKEIPL
jgi:hypothetical protein